jgi:hypothetical protein
MTSSRLRRLGCGVLGASEAARERRRTEAARAIARARARSCWSSLEPSGNAGGGDCSSSREPAAVPRAGGGVGASGAPAAESSSAGGIWDRWTAARGKGIGFGALGLEDFCFVVWWLPGGGYFKFSGKPLEISYYST